MCVTEPADFLHFGGDENVYMCMDFGRGGRNLVHYLHPRPSQSEVQSVWTTQKEVVSSQREILSLPDSCFFTKFAMIDGQKVILREISGGSIHNFSFWAVSNVRPQQWADISPPHASIGYVLRGYENQTEKRKCLPQKPSPKITTACRSSNSIPFQHMAYTSRKENSLLILPQILPIVCCLCVCR